MSERCHQGREATRKGPHRGHKSLHMEVSREECKGGLTKGDLLGVGGSARSQAVMGGWRMAPLLSERGEKKQKELFEDGMKQIPIVSNYRSFYSN